MEVTEMEVTEMEARAIMNDHYATLPTVRIAPHILLALKDVKEAFFLSALMENDYTKDEGEFFPYPDSRWQEEFGCFSYHEVKRIRESLIDKGFIEAKRAVWPGGNITCIHYKLNVANIINYSLEEEAN